MAILVEGILIEVIIVLAVSAFMLYVGRLKDLLPLRRLAALDVIDEFVGRSTEMGRPVLVTPSSRFGLQSNYAPSTVVGLDMVAHVARLCCETGAEIIIGVGQPDVLTVTYELYRDACMGSGHPEMYKEENVRFFSKDGFRAGMIEILEREKAGSLMMFGEMWWDNVTLGGSARRAGALSIGSGAWFDMAAVGFVNCDYMLLADEQFCAGAYVSRDPGKSNLLLGADVIKWFFIIFCVLGTILSTAGSSIITDLLKL